MCDAADGTFMFPMNLPLWAAVLGTRPTQPLGRWSSSCCGFLADVWSLFRPSLVWMTSFAATAAPLHVPQIACLRSENNCVMQQMAHSYLYLYTPYLYTTYIFIYTPHNCIYTPHTYYTPYIYIHHIYLYTTYIYIYTTYIYTT